MKTEFVPGSLSRRRLLLLAAAALAAGPWGCDDGAERSDDGADAGTDAPPAPPRLELPACFDDLDGVRRVGRRYLELNPLLTPSELLKELKPGRGFAVLEAEIRDQYARGEVVRLDGWPLALTELRLYAAVALN